MRAKISYSVEFEEIPEQISMLLDKALRLTGNVSKRIDFAREQISLADPSRLVLVPSELDTIRQDLGKVDLVLQDCISISNGYVEAIDQLQKAQLQQDEVKQGNNDDE